MSTAFGYGNDLFDVLSDEIGLEARYHPDCAVEMNYLSEQLLALAPLYNALCELVLEKDHGSDAKYQYQLLMARKR